MKGNWIYCNDVLLFFFTVLAHFSFEWLRIKVIHFFGNISKWNQRLSNATPKPKHISKCKALGATYFSFGVSFQNVSDFSFNFKMLPDNGLTFILGHWFVLLSSNLLPFSTIARLVWQHKQQVIEWSFSFCLDISKVVWGMNHADQ